jgi:hypothetical protein
MAWDKTGGLAQYRDGPTISVRAILAADAATADQPPAFPQPLIQIFLNAKIVGEVDSPTSSERNGPNASGPNHLASGCADSRIRTRRLLTRQAGRWRVGLGRPSLGAGGQLGPKERTGLPSQRRLR